MKNLLGSFLFILLCVRLSGQAPGNHYPDWIVSPSEGDFINNISTMDIELDHSVLNPETIGVEAELYRDGVYDRDLPVVATDGNRYKVYLGASSSGLVRGVPYSIKVTTVRFVSHYDWVHNVFFFPSKDHNQIISRIYDENGLVGVSLSAFDATGKPMQTQSMNLTEGITLASQPLYDRYNRAAGQTLVAPVSGLGYKSNFIQNSSGETYTSTDFDQPVPGAISNTTASTLGYYYSDNNTDEPNVAASSYPFTRTEYYDDGSGEVKSTSNAGEPFVTDDNRKVYSKTFPVLNDLDGMYLTLYKKLTGNNPGSFSRKVIKTVTRDANGREMISYTDESDNTLVTAHGYLSDPKNRVAWTINYNREDWPFRQSSGHEYNVMWFHLPEGTHSVEVYGRDKPFIIDPDDEEWGGNEETWTTTLSKGFYRCWNCEKISYTVKYYDPSFNFYDDKGRLIVSIAPKGVDAILNGYPLDGLGLSNLPYATYYEYDFQGRLVSIRETDAGETRYIYRKDGSIRFSQNQKQRKLAADENGGKGYFSYTNYDQLGRPTESGEYIGATYGFGDALKTSEILEDKTITGGLDLNKYTRRDWVRTQYDQACDCAAEDEEEEETPDEVKIGGAYRLKEGLNLIQATDEIKLTEGFDFRPQDSRYLRAEIFEEEAAMSAFTMQAHNHTDDHVSASASCIAGRAQAFIRGAVSCTSNDHSRTLYSYDELGRVAWMAVGYPGIFDDYKITEYAYDFLGNVTEVKYQEGNEDAFYHYYEYDADKRLTKVYAAPAQIDKNDPSADALQAKYEYYLHGPLKKVILANGLEETEYFYTLQGWLKSINNPENDEHVFAQSFKYFNGDYTRTGVEFPYVNPPIPQYTGNIASITSRTDFNGEVNEQTMHYIYDRKDQLISAFNGVDNTYSTDDLTYDANGNLLNLKRYGKSGVLHDFTGDAGNDGYLYTSGTNKLKRVFGMNAAETEEVEYARYEYNKIGQMTELYRDRDGEPEQWGFGYDVAGKVLSITDQSTDTDQMVYSYAYDDRGFRIRKTDHVYSNPQSVYVRDASGSIMAVYTEDGSGNYTPIEHPVYGTSRLGTYYDVNGQTHYELKDHLGNVRATVVGNATFSRTFEDEVGMTWGDDPNSEFTTAQAHSGVTSWSIRDDQDYMEITVTAGDVVSAEVWLWKVSGSAPAFKVYRDDWTEQASATIASTTASWQKLTISDLVVSQSGSLYIVFEEGNNVSSYFDDLEVVRSIGERVAQSTDFYPFGLVMRRQGGEYRFAYQGDFAEEDSETGFNHFEARDYDPVIGRTMVVDPSRQYFSPYTWVGNDPVNFFDPTGGTSDPVKSKYLASAGSDTNLFGSKFEGAAPDPLLKPVEAFGYLIGRALETGWDFFQKLNPPEASLMPGPQSIIGSEAAFVNSTLKGYFLRSSSQIVDKNYIKTIQILGKVDDNANLFSLVKALEMEALENGATQITLRGTDILNPDLLNISPKMAERMGYSITRTGDDSIELIKILSNE